MTRRRLTFAADPRLGIVKARNLTRPQGAPSVGSVLSPHRASVVDTLSPERLARVMRSADEGDPEAYLTLAEEMEEREPHYASVLHTRKLGVSGSSRFVTASDDSSDARALAEDVEELVQRPEFEGLVLDLMDGVAKGFSAVEILWELSESQWSPVGYEFRPQRHFTFDRDTLSIPRLRSLSDPLEGVPLEPYKWLVHTPKIRSGIPLRTGLARTVAVTYAAKRWTIADWLTFLDRYGVPVRIGRYPSNMEDKKRKLLRAVQQLGHDAAAVIPDEMTVEILEAKATGAGTTLFAESATYWDKQTSKVVLGQTMTTDDGNSLAQSRTHERVRFDIRAADARAVSATIMRDLIRPYVDLNYGPQERYPLFEIQCDEPEDTTSKMEATRVFVAMGGRVQMSEVRDMLGWAEPEDGAELLQPESVVSAAAAQAPADDADDAGPEAETDTPGSDADEDEALGPDAELDQRELNRQRFATRPETADVVDNLREQALRDWQPLLDSNVGRLLERIQNAATYEEARALLAELARDEGDVLDVAALAASLARASFRVRGIGDATDDVDGRPEGDA